MLLPETLSVLLACSSVTPPDGGRERAAVEGREGVCGGLYTAAMELEKRAPDVTGHMHAHTHARTHTCTYTHTHMHARTHTNTYTSRKMQSYDSFWECPLIFKS